MQRMVEDAKAHGADAVINVRLSTSMVMQGCSEILAYGTAVKLTNMGSISIGIILIED